MSKMQIFSVLITEIDKENGSISQMTVESTHRTKEEAYEAIAGIELIQTGEPSQRRELEALPGQRDHNRCRCCQRLTNTDTR